MPLLGRIDRAARISVKEHVRGDESRHRAASLQPRKLSNYLPLSLRLVGLLICAFALGFLTAEISVAPADARLTMPIGYAAIALSFFLLYEAWIRSEALGAQVLGSNGASGPTAEEAEWTRRRRVRAIFMLQSTLTLLFSVMGLIATGIDWNSPTGSMIGALLGASAVIVGGVGCAFALSSEMGDRYLRLAMSRR